MPTENVAEPILRLYTDPQSSSEPQPSSAPQPGSAPTRSEPTNPDSISSRPSYLKPLSTQTSARDYNPPGRGQTILLMAGISFVPSMRSMFSPCSASSSACAWWGSASCSCRSC